MTLHPPLVNQELKLISYLQLKIFWRDWLRTTFALQKHGTTSKPLKAVRLDSDEQAKIAKSGLEMKMMSSEMDAETEKWQGAAADENNDIVKRYAFTIIGIFISLNSNFNQIQIRN